MSAPSVSVIIVNWNTRDMVLRLLKSLSEPDETGHQLELTVVDNNSSDDSVDIGCRHSATAAHSPAYSPGYPMPSSAHRG